MNQTECLLKNLHPSEWWNHSEYVKNGATIERTNKQICQTGLRAANSYIKGTLSHNGFMKNGSKKVSKTTRKNCSKGHEKITFFGSKCPLCDVLQEVKRLESHSNERELV